MRAWLNLRLSLPARVEAFSTGLKRLGYRVEVGLPTRPEGLLVTWNRIRTADLIARQFEAEGLPVLVAENAAWGNEFAGGGWVSLARNHHNTAGRFPVGGPERWDGLGIDLAPWRTRGSEVVILPQRGIGSAPVAMPRDWTERVRRETRGRVRPHPGGNDAVSLEHDLANARLAVTWGSGAAVKALLLGVPVRSDMPNWIAAQDNTDEGRLAMFRRLAWAQWRREEIADGTAFRRLLGDGSLRTEIRAPDSRPDAGGGIARLRRQA